jgi:hypothetical protein
MGSVDLGIRAQLGEIERGFFDRAGSSLSGTSKSDTFKSGTSKSDAAEPVGEASGSSQESRA